MKNYWLKKRMLKDWQEQFLYHIGIFKEYYLKLSADERKLIIEKFIRDNK